MTNNSATDDLADDLESINRTTQDVLEKSDRIRAVLLGTQIDHLLLRLLQTYLIPKKGKNDRLLDGSGFAGTFSARIELAFRIGLISPDWYHDLKIINEIRDAFAHGLAGLTLNDPALSKLCHSLKIAYGNIRKDTKAATTVINPQTRFVGSSVVLSSHLCLARTKLKRTSEAWNLYNKDAVRFGDQNTTEENS